MEVEKRVYLCINYDEYTQENIIADLDKEGYEFFFHFGNDLENVEDADEFWTFGDVSNIEAYKKAVDLNKEIWVMK